MEIPSVQPTDVPFSQPGLSLGRFFNFLFNINVMLFSIIYLVVVIHFGLGTYRFVHFQKIITIIYSNTSPFYSSETAIICIGASL